MRYSTSSFYSSDLRKVVMRLDRSGYSFQDTQDVIAAELCVLSFYPNHIIGVIDKVIGDSEIKAERLLDTGWDYLEKPIRSMLSSRTAAIRSTGIVEETKLWGEEYEVIQRMLQTDMTMEESRILFLEIPSLLDGSTLYNLRVAVNACRERDVRSVYYLAGVLRREHQRQESRTREILEGRSQAEPWTPPIDYRGPGSDVIELMEKRWQEKQRDIDLLKDG